MSENTMDAAITELEKLRHEHKLMLTCLKKIAEYQVDESEWCDVAESMYWTTVECLKEIEDKK